MIIPLTTECMCSSIPEGLTIKINGQIVDVLKCCDTDQKTVFVIHCLESKTNPGVFLSIDPTLSTKETENP